MPTFTDMWTELPAQAYELYDLHVERIARLDRQGEDCTACDRDGATVGCQWYGVEFTGQDVCGECCTDCLPEQLATSGVDQTRTVWVEMTQ